MGVTTRRHGPVLLIRMDREHKRNAIDAEMTAGLDAALNELDDDPLLLAGVLAGTRLAFSAGTDCGRSGASRPRAAATTGRSGGSARPRWSRRSRASPTAAGSSWCWPATWWWPAAAPGSLPETARGLVANCGALFRAPRALPRNIALELLLTGEPLGAERAWTLGLVNAWSSRGRRKPARSRWRRRWRRTGRSPARHPARRRRDRGRRRRPRLGGHRQRPGGGQCLHRRGRGRCRVPRETRAAMARALTRCAHCLGE